MSSVGFYKRFCLSPLTFDARLASAAKQAGVAEA